MSVQPGLVPPGAARADLVIVGRNDIQVIPARASAPDTRGPHPVAPGAPGDFWTAIGAGWAALVGALGAALVGIGYALPWIALVGVLALIVILIVRMSRRKGKAA